MKELEVKVSDFDAMKRILQALGFHCEQTYEKWRETLLYFIPPTPFRISTSIPSVICHLPPSSVIWPQGSRRFHGTSFSGKSCSINNSPLRENMYTVAA
jgi:hypothetical protein